MQAVPLGVSLSYNHPLTLSFDDDELVYADAPIAYTSECSTLPATAMASPYTSAIPLPPPRSRSMSTSRTSRGSSDGFQAGPVAQAAARLEAATCASSSTPCLLPPRQRKPSVLKKQQRPRHASTGNAQPGRPGLDRRRTVSIMARQDKYPVHSTSHTAEDNASGRSPPSASPCSPARAPLYSRSLSLPLTRGLHDELTDGSSSGPDEEHAASPKPEHSDVASRSTSPLAASSISNLLPSTEAPSSLESLLPPFQGMDVASTADALPQEATPACVVPVSHDPTPSRSPLASIPLVRPAQFLPTPAPSPDSTGRLSSGAYRSFVRAGTQQFRRPVHDHDTD